MFIVPGFEDGNLSWQKTVAFDNGEANNFVGVQDCSLKLQKNNKNAGN